MSVPFRTLDANFNGGEVTPLLDGRADTAVYKDACRLLENFVVRPYGGAFKRPGTQYGGEVKTSSTATRLIPFKRSTNTNYMLEFGVNYIRVWTGGANMTQVTVSGVTAWAASTAYVIGDVRSSGGVNYWCKTAHTSAGVFSATNWQTMTGTIFEMYSPYGAADLFALQVTRINDVMFIAHPSYEPRRLSRSADTSWVLDVVPWDFPPMDDVNDTTTNVKLQPNVVNWVTSTAYTVGQVRLTSGQAIVCAIAHTSGVLATDIGAGKWVAARFVGPWERQTVYYLGDVVDAAGIRYTCISGHTAADATRPTSGASYATAWLAVGDTALRMFSSAAIFASTDVGASWRIDIGANKRAIFLDGHIATNASYLSEPMLIQGDILIHSNWTSTNGILGNLFLEESTDRVTFNSVRQWSIQSTGDGNLSSTYTGTNTGRYYRFRFESTTSNSQAFGFFAEMVNGMVTALVTISSYVSSTEVACTFALPNITFCPTEILNKPSTGWYRPAFSGTNGYPRSVAFHEGRLFWAGTSGNPSRLWSSRTDDYYNCLINADADAGLDLTLAALEANQIEWIMSQGQALVAGTTGEEWTIDGGATDAALTPTNVRARRRTRRGSTTLAPQLVSDAMLWVGRGGKRLHEFSYNFAADRYEAPDMTIYAEHVTAGGIVQTAFAAEPDTILWAVTGSGTLIGLTYDRAQQITAWHRHTTSGGAFESVATMYGSSGRDEVWFIVNRTINGSTKRYVERFYPTAQDFNFDTATDLFYVDCGKKVTPTGTAVTGLSHLAAATVSAWSDGARIDTGTVTGGGGLTLSASTATAIVGIPITSKVEPMRLEIVLQDGTGQGRHWRPNRVIFLLHKSIGGKFADAPDATMQSIDVRTPYQIEQGTAASLAMFTGRASEHVQADWNESVNFTVQHDSPTPFNLLGYILVSEVSGS